MATSSSSADALFDIPWVEKYRPTRVVDVVGNSDAVSRLQVIARDGNMPNLILSVCPPTSNWNSTFQFICVLHFKKKSASILFS
jgi:replication factor C subunit 2/4